MGMIEYNLCIRHIFKHHLYYLYADLDEFIKKKTILIIKHITDRLRGISLCVTAIEFFLSVRI